MTHDQNDIARIEREAADWLAIVNSDGASDGELFAFEEWMRADARHREAFVALEAIWNDVAEMTELRTLVKDYSSRPIGGFSVQPMLAALKRPFAAPAFGAVAAFLAIIIFALPFLLTRPHAKVFETAIAEVRDVRLADGSIVTLGPKSELRTKISRSERTARLLSGEAFFNVAHNPNRVFAVKAGEAKVQVLGTKFNVKLTPHETRVAVAQGLVALTAIGKHTPPAQLTVGKSASVSMDGVLTTLGDADPSTFGAWRGGRLIYDNAPLSEVVADLNRYSSRPIRLGSPEERVRLVTASFRTDQTDAILSSIAATLSLAVERRPNGEIILSRPTNE